MNGNEKMIRQLTSILLDNALKYSPENGTIMVSLKKDGTPDRARHCVSHREYPPWTDPGSLIGWEVADN